MKSLETRLCEEQKQGCLAGQKKKRGGGGGGVYDDLAWMLRKIPRLSKVEFG